MKNRKFHKYKAVLTYKTKDEIESRIMGEKYSKVVLDVYMSPEEFGTFVTDLTGHEFTISIS